MALPTEEDYRALRQIQIDRNGGIDPNATPSELEKQLDAINAKRGDTAGSAIASKGETTNSEELTANETQQLSEGKSSAEVEDPFEKARQDAEDAYNEPGPTEANVPVETKQTESTRKTIDAAPKLEIRQNPLHKYATYTYGISLYILTPADINQISTTPELWVPGAGGVKTCLISSGGKNSGVYSRNDNFKDDFYFDSLSMTTVIGLNNRSKSSNAIEIAFNVVEPYGMSLLDRIIATANEIKAPNFKAMPYLLEIDFYGYDDTGKASKLDDQRKRIPIQIIELKIKVNTKGSEYAIKAVPWNHQALSQSAVSTPINVEVAASTVAEFFANNGEDHESITKQELAKLNAKDNNQRIEKETKDLSGSQTTGTGPVGGGRGNVNPTPVDPDKSARTPEQSKSLNDNQAIVAKAFSVKSFCGGINGWFTDLIAKRLRVHADVINVEFHGSKEVPVEKIRDAKITVPAKRDISRSAAPATGTNTTNSARAFSDATAFPVSAGTSIPQVIDMVMRNSSYVTDQISDPKDTKPIELAEKLKKPLYWYKVVPSVEVLGYDYAINKFATKTTYHIIPYIVYDSKHPNGPTLAPSGAVKEYSYTYTGKNLDVLDLQIDFDTLFYTAVTAGSAKWQADLIQKAKQELDDAQNAAKSSSEAAAQLVNRQLRLVSSQPQQQGLGGQQGSAEQILAADIQKSQYSNSRGDMLNLKLKITGDPELIKQDDVYTNPLQGGYADQMSNSIIPQGGSIPMDNGEVVAQVNFRTIVDMDETTGLPRQNSLSDKSVFSGKYRMLTVANTFQGGKFEQVIDMVRLPEPPPEKNKTEIAKDTNKDPNAREPSSGASGDDLSMFYDMGPEEVLDESNGPIQLGGPTDEDEIGADDGIADDNGETNEEEDLQNIDADTETVEMSADEWENSGGSIETKQVDSDF